MQLTKQFVATQHDSQDPREGVEGVVSGASVACNLELRRKGKRKKEAFLRAGVLGKVPNSLLQFHMHR